LLEDIHARSELACILDLEAGAAFFIGINGGADLILLAVDSGPSEHAPSIAATFERSFRVNVSHRDCHNGTESERNHGRSQALSPRDNRHRLAL